MTSAATAAPTPHAVSDGIGARSPGLGLTWGEVESLPLSDFALAAVPNTELYEIDRVLSWKSTAAEWASTATLQAAFVTRRSGAPHSGTPSPTAHKRWLEPQQGRAGKRQGGGSLLAQRSGGADVRQLRLRHPPSSLDNVLLAHELVGVGSGGSGGSGNGGGSGRGGAGGGIGGGHSVSAGGRAQLDSFTRAVMLTLFLPDDVRASSVGSRRSFEAVSLLVVVR